VVKRSFFEVFFGEKALQREINRLATVFLTILLVSLAVPLLVQPSLACENDGISGMQVVPGQWYKLTSNNVTVLFPSGGRKPMFIWWYNNEPNQIYVVKYQGLMEYFAFNNTLLGIGNPMYYSRMREAWSYRFGEMYMRPWENHWMGMGMKYVNRLMLLRQIWNQTALKWHNAFLPFDAARWNLTDIKNITTPEGKAVGVSFAFKLVSTWLPGFKFAENNIMIRVRFYNQSVIETVPGTTSTYTVNAGEMKMDFVVNKWVWNMDTVKQLAANLQNERFNVTIPQGESRLALWVNLASINKTKLSLAENEPETIESQSTATHISIEDNRVKILANKTATEQEQPIVIQKPVIKLGFANETKTLGGFFRFVSSAKVTNGTSVEMVPVKASYIAAGSHMRLFIGYSYFGNGTLEHDPSIGVDTPQTQTGPSGTSPSETGPSTPPQVTVQTPTGMDDTPVVIGGIAIPLFTPELMIVLVVIVSFIAVTLYMTKWKSKTPVNMVGTK
jgi:hypothetical protein